MKQIAARVGRRVYPLVKLASEYTAVHIATRLFAALSGLMLVRILPVKEYGFFTLALSAFTFICSFSDLGATETLSFFRWRAVKRNKSWAPYFHAVLRFRRLVFVVGFIASAIYVYNTGQRIGEVRFTILVTVIIIGIGAWFAVQSGIISYAFKLEQRFRLAYAVDISNEGIKLLAVCVIWFLGITSAMAGMLSVAFSYFVTALFAKILFSRLQLDKNCETKPRHIRQTNRVLFGQIIPIIPGAIYFGIQGPLVAGLVAYFGSVVSLAEVGALGRIGVLISVIASFTSTVFVPRLLAISDEKLFFKRYLQWWLVIIALGCGIYFSVAMFPHALLNILGDAYSGLHSALLIATATAVIISWASYAWGINRARGWVRYQPGSVPTTFVFQIIMVFSLDFSSTIGALLFGLGSGLVGLLYQIMINMHGFIVSEQKLDLPAR